MEAAPQPQSERRSGDRLSRVRTTVAIAALSLGLWWLLWTALAALIKVLF